MMEEELITIWQSSSKQERVKFEKSRLMIDVQTSLDNFHRKVKYRDLREYIAVAIIIPAFIYAAFIYPQLLTKIASILIVGYGLFVAIKLRNAKKHKPGAYTDSYIGYLNQTRNYLLVQKQLLDSVLYWYILPGVAFTMLFTLGFGITDRLKPILKMAGLNAVMAVSVYFLNKRAVKLEIVPRLEKVDKLIRLLEKN